MKAVFTCDDVFDRLTREPFPSGSADDELVEMHLAVCHECRQLAEAFRPAVGLFHESMSAESNAELPMYSGRLQPIIEALVLNARTQSKPASAPTRWSSLTSLVVAVAVGVMFIGSVILATLADPQPAGDRQQLASQNHHQQQHQNQLLLATLEIPETCRATTVAWGLAASTDLACCTQCHKADSPVPSTEKAIAKSTAACVACHDGTSSDSISAVPNRRDWYLDFDRLRIHVRRKYEQINLQLAIAIAPMRARDVRTSATTTDLEACQVARLEVGVAVVLPKCDELYVERSTHPQHARISMFDVARTKYLPVAACEADRRC